MRIIKRLYTFMLQQFTPLLVMTFFISLFVVLMQFLWRYVEDLVGKGLSIGVICELFFYAALTMVPTALPLAVLLASLMTFGNLGEKFELTAMKAAGVSLFQIMKPLIVLMTAIAIGAFFFQNYALPVAQTKMWTLLFSMKQKSPEVEIPVKAFYDQIPGMNLYVESKNPDTGMLYDLIIYDQTRGYDNARVILADSGKLNFTEDKTRLFLHLYQGEMFENLRGNDFGLSTSNYLPFRRESFGDKQIYFMFDANFNRIDENSMRRQYIGKNVAQLKSSIDSIANIVDSIGDTYGYDIKTRSYVDVPYYVRQYTDSGMVQTIRAPVSMPEHIDIDSILGGGSPSAAKMNAQQALTKAQRQRQDYEFRSTVLLEQAKLMRRHDIELQKKFTLSFACLVFFFIGAPLGAIIKKGGIGTPLVISVFLFIVYFIFDNFGYKLARDGKVEVWVGIWLSSIVMLPLGIFFTYKAVGDSAVFNLDAYVSFFKKLVGIRPKRSLGLKEVVMTEVDSDTAQQLLRDISTLALEAKEASKRKLPWRLLRPHDYAPLDQAITLAVEHLSNTRSAKVVAKLNEYPFNVNRHDIPDVISITHELAGLLESQQLSDHGSEN